MKRLTIAAAGLALLAGLVWPVQAAERLVLIEYFSNTG